VFKLGATLSGAKTRTVLLRILSIKIFRDISEEYTETGYNKKRLPGDYRDVESSSFSTNVINNIIVTDAEMNGKGQKK